MDDSAQLKGYERRFRRAGLPLFVEGFSASTDVFNRAAPLLGIVFLGELLGAGQLDWTWWQNVLAVLGGLAAFSGFYFAVAMLTDSTYREEFLEELTDEMRISFKARSEYLRLRGRVEPAPDEAAS